MKEFSNIDLKEFNTFNLPCIADKLVILEDEKDISLCFDKRVFNGRFLILSGGSNVLLCEKFPGIVFHPAFRGIQVEKVKGGTVTVTVKAGVIWDDFVAWCVVNDFGGLENLSLIPGYCGSAPVQNIGAFGSEISQHLLYVDGINLLSGKSERIDNNDCSLGYRTSVFKTDLKEKFFITSTTYSLTVSAHSYHLDYGNLSEKLKNRLINLSEIRRAVIDIRRNKLPDPQVTGNAGSFFKNPAISHRLAKKIKDEFPDVPLYPLDEGRNKIAAGWLIEQCGWKGKRHGDAGVHSKQALVIVNHGNSTQREILELAEMIINSVNEKFGIFLEKEVNFIS